MSLYNLINGVNPATFFFLPMLGKHPDEFPRFRDCFVGEDCNSIVVYTRVGGNNRNRGFGEEKLYNHPNFVKTYDDDIDSTYGYYVFSVPDEWRDDFINLLTKTKVSDAYLEQMCKVFPKLENIFRSMFKSNEAGGLDKH